MFINKLISQDDKETHFCLIPSSIWHMALLIGRVKFRKNSITLKISADFHTPIITEREIDPCMLIVFVYWLTMLALPSFRRILP